MKLEYHYCRIFKSSESMLHILSAIHYNPGTLTNFALPVKSKGIDFKCHFC